MNSKFNIEISNKAIGKIVSFYNNVGLKFPNTNTGEVIEKNIANTINSIHSIKQNTFIRNSYIDEWAKYKMITCGKWNFAVDIKENKMVIVDACHQLNMTNNKSMEDLFEEELNASTPRITDITFPPARNNRYFIRCKIDGEQQFMKEIATELLDDYKNDRITKYQLAERCYDKELKEDRMNLEQFLHKGRKI